MPLKPSTTPCTRRAHHAPAVVNCTLLTECRNTSNTWETAPAILHSHHLLCLLNRFAQRSRAERPDGSQPAFACDPVALRLNRYPPDYQGAFAFSIIPYPLPHRFTLRLTFPCGRASGLPRSADRPEWIGSRLFAGGTTVCERRRENTSTWPLTFWSKPAHLAMVQPLRLVEGNDVYQRFTMC